MSGFFQGWRRKIGIMLLGCALTIAALWMRSHLVYDMISFAGLGEQHYIHSFCGILTWQSGKLDGAGICSWNSRTLDSEMSRMIAMLDIKIYGAWIPVIEDQAVAEHEIPYWWLVLPQVVLSGLLILWSPRKKSLDPIHPDVSARIARRMDHCHSANS